MIIFAPELQCVVCNFDTMTNEKIIHQGKIERIGKNKVFVRIEQKAACSECHAANVCVASEKKEMIIEVDDYSGNFELQEDVLISAQSSMGLFAAVIAFAIPLLTVILSVITGACLSNSEVIGGLTGLAVLGVYYSVLFLLRGKIKRNLLFSISKIPYPSIIIKHN